jgi:four helix bundle protein
MRNDGGWTKDAGRETKDDGRETKGRKMIDDRRTRKRINSVRDLDVYRLAFDTAMEIFNITKTFPKEEKYSLIDQIRRSSRSVCTNITEAWRKRKYKAMFISKLTDAEQEAAETQTWLEFALKCNYINKNIFERLDDQYEHIFTMLVTMERKAESFCR